MNAVREIEAEFTLSYILIDRQEHRHHPWCSSTDLIIMIRRALRTPRPKPMAIVTQPARLAALPTISSAACFGTRAVPVVAQASTSQLRIAAPRRTYAAKTMKFKQA